MNVKKAQVLGFGLLFLLKEPLSVTKLTFTNNEV